MTPQAQNRRVQKSAQNASSRPVPQRGYAHGNRNWNTQTYKEGVRTEHTDTTVLPTKRDPSRGSYYYDVTPAALREKRRKEFAEKRSKWRDAAKKNRRRSRAARRVLSLLIIIGTVIGTFAVSYKLFFVANDVTVVGAKTYSSEQIVAASGLDRRTNLFSFSSRLSGEAVSFFCPRVSSAKFDRTIPNKVEITVEEENPVFYTEVYGEYYGVSDSLRILDKMNKEDTDGLIRLKLQTVKKAVSGEKIQLKSERAEQFLETATEILGKYPLKSRLTQINLENDFDINMVADNKYRLVFGTQDEFEIKVRLASAILNDEIFKSGSKALINLEDTERTSVIIDNQLVFD